MVMKNKHPEIPVQNILGKYEGECADANITNKNGLDITRPVWENVFNSEEYKQAIELGWYIGFLGHPDDPNCMDFRNACIVMRDGRIDDNGKIYGSFDLIDTPVGRVVKAFQDAGVKFGISVRGAGDILDNSVDPDTFVFRGFDLVTFPAYPESIPTFTSIAASSDVKYQKVCAALKANLSDIHSCEALSVLQSQFAKQSDEYKAIEAQKSAINSEDCINSVNSDKVVKSVDKQKLEAMTQLYLEAIQANRQLKSELVKLQSSYDRKLRRLEQITSSQMVAVNKKSSTFERRHLTAVAASRRLKNEIEVLKSRNLKYNQDVKSRDNTIQSKDSILANVRRQLNETVMQLKEEQRKSSNLDEQNARLQNELVTANTMLSQYRDEYISLYATAVGVNPSSIPVTASTSVSDLKQLVANSARSDLDDILETPDVEIDDSVCESSDIVTI